MSKAEHDNVEEPQFEQLSLLQQIYADRIPIKMLLFRYWFLWGLTSIVLGFVLTALALWGVTGELALMKVLTLFSVLQVPFYCFAHTLLLVLPIYRAMRNEVDPALSITLLAFILLVCGVLLTPMVVHYPMWSTRQIIMIPLLLIPITVVTVALMTFKTEVETDRRTFRARGREGESEEPSDGAR